MYVSFCTEPSHFSLFISDFVVSVKEYELFTGLFMNLNILDFTLLSKLITVSKMTSRLNLNHGRSYLVSHFIYMIILS